MLDPGAKLFAFLGGTASGLVRQVGGNVAIGDDDLPLFECGDDRSFAFKAITGVKQRREVRVMVRAEVAIQKLADHLAEPGVVLREAGRQDLEATGFESLRQKADLGLFAAPVDAFNGDELSASVHYLPEVCKYKPRTPKCERG